MKKKQIISTQQTKDFVHDASLSQVADILVRSTTEVMRLASTEEDLRIGFEKALDPIRQALGILSVPKYEKSIYRSGRADSLHGQVIIEYEAPNAFTSKKWVEHAFKQLLGYIRGEADANKNTLFLFDPKFVGVGFDGSQIFFVQYAGDKNKAKVSLQECDFLLIGPYEFNSQSSRTLLAYIRALSRRLLTAENLAEVFGPQSSLTVQAVSAFADAFEYWAAKPRVRAFFNEWKRLFGIVYGEQFTTQQAQEVKKLSELYKISKETDFQELLFSVHTYFVFLMKLIAAELLTISETSFRSSFSHDLAHADKQALLTKLDEIEAGGVYARRGITNFLEGDFFRWYLDAFSPRLEEAIRDIARAFSDFEPATSTINPDSTRDLLKKLYQYLVPQEVRHKLGEYYTPDWLAELVLNEVGYDGNTLKRLIDPACGSGTFIVLAIKRAIEHGQAERLHRVEIVKRIVAHIWGFDLNPLAIIASRTNYLFALGDLVYDLESFEIPIYLADSVLWPESGGQIQLGIAGDVVHIPTSIATFFVPSIWVKDKGFLMRIAAPLVEEMARQHYTPDEALKRFRDQGLVFPPHELAVKNFYEQILKLEQEGKNGIWARFLKNVFAPMIAGEFDYVVGNPPWIRWDYLSAQYRSATLPLWKNYGLFSLTGFETNLGGGKKDFSMLFTYAAIDYYLSKNGKLGFLVTQEVFKSKGAGEGFRRFKLGKEGTSRDFKVLKAHDLTSVQPFEGASNKTAAIFVKKGDKTHYPVPYTVWNRKRGCGRIPTDATLSDALPQLQKKRLDAKPIGRLTSAWQTVSSNEANLGSIQGSNTYKAILGANPNPYGVFWLTVQQVLSDGNIIVRNLPEKGKLEIDQVEETVESALVYPALRGSDIKRWGHEQKIFLLMSQNPDTREPYPQQIMKSNWPRTYGYLLRFKDILLTRGSKTIRRLAERTEFYAMFGIERKTIAPYKVVWKAMSNDIHATVVSTIKTIIGHKIAIPLHTTSFFACSDELEAHYLCSIVNSVHVRTFIRSFSSAGRGFGTPSVMEHVGIPRFDSNNKLHHELAELSKALHNLKATSQTDEIQQLERKNDELVRKLFQA